MRSLVAAVERLDPLTVSGRVAAVNGLLIEARGGLSRLAVGAHASLMIEMKVSEDAIRLYGFGSAEEREWFRLLTTVQGVGAKVALAILSALSPDQLIAALEIQLLLDVLAVGLDGFD